jgi:hypothetical protein
MFRRLYGDSVSSVLSTREGVYKMIMFDADSVAAVAADVIDCAAHVVFVKVVSLEILFVNKKDWLIDT